MCILVVCSPNKTPKAEDLHAGACSNPHGFGFAIDTGDEIISERSMSAKKSIARFLELRAQYPNGYAMWHARYATHGVKNEQNCHPFRVGNDQYTTYLAHNGVLDMIIGDKDKRSDTRVFAEDTLPLLGGVEALDDENVFNLISKFASGSKIAIMTNNPRATYRMYIINESLGTWDYDDIWWSNQSHKRHLSPPSVVNSYTTGYHYKSQYVEPTTTIIGEYNYEELGEYDVLDECPYCQGTTNLSENPYYCTACEICFDCELVMHDCLCYTPTKSRHPVYYSKQSFEDMLY